MFSVRWIARSSLLISAAVILAGCLSLTSREPPASIEKAESLERQGDDASAGRVYEQLAAQNSGADRNDYVFRAVHAYLAAHRPEDAARVLATLEEPLTTAQQSERPLLEIELALARGQSQQAWQRVSALPEPQDTASAARYWRLRERAALAAGHPTEAVSAQIALERRLPGVAELRQSRIDLLHALRDASAHGMRMDPRASKDSTVRGWLELGPIMATAASSSNAALADVDAWRARYPNHPAADIVRTELLGKQPAPVAQVSAAGGAAQIALLLPLSGRTASAAASVRDGFMTAYYQAPAQQRGAVTVYDTGEAGVAEVVARAAHDGAQIIVGPLTREEVVAAAALTEPRPPMLALNFLASDRPAPQGFYQFALSPEDEARLAARRALADGHHHGVAIVPSGDWGSRVLSAFTQELEAGGGSLFNSVTIDAALTDYSDAITQVLRINESNARRRRLESLLGTKLVFEPRRRGDLEFIFAPAQANVERLLRPQLRFHFAGDVATYATSDAFDPDPRNNQDLEGLMFPDMPWMLGSDLAEAVRTALHDAYPSGGPRRNRLFAFGFDAYRLAAALRANSGTPQLDGLTGRLIVDTEHRIHRELGWAQIHNGEIQMLPGTGVTAAASRTHPMR